MAPAIDQGPESNAAALAGRAAKTSYPEMFQDPCGQFSVPAPADHGEDVHVAVAVYYGGKGEMPAGDYFRPGEIFYGIFMFQPENANMAAPVKQPEQARDEGGQERQPVGKMLPLELIPAWNGSFVQAQLSTPDH